MVRCPKKIVLPDVVNRGTCCLDRDGHWLLDTAYAIVLSTDEHLDLCYILALLNSPLLTCFLQGLELRYAVATFQ